jgi:tRNA pseudouridine55 synthase
MLSQAHPLAELEALAGNLPAPAGNLPAFDQLCLHPRTLLPEMPSVTADAQALGRLRNGAQANLPEFSQASLVKVFADQRDLVGIAKRIAGTLFQPVAVMG